MINVNFNYKKEWSQNLCTDPWRERIWRALHAMDCATYYVAQSISTCWLGDWLHGDILKASPKEWSQNLYTDPWRELRLLMQKYTTGMQYDRAHVHDIFITLCSYTGSLHDSKTRFNFKRWVSGMKNLANNHKGCLDLNYLSVWHQCIWYFQLYNVMCGHTTINFCVTAIVNLSSPHL